MIKEEEEPKVFKFQQEASDELFLKLYVENRRGVLLQGGVGTGKTFVLGNLLLRIEKEIDLITIYPSIYPVFYVTKASIVEQTTRVLRDHFKLNMTNILVINYDQLRASFGELYIKETKKVVKGEVEITLTWNPLHPLLIIWDECQSVKNEGSLQTEVAQSATNINHPMFRQVYASATPFVKVSEAKTIACGMGIEIN